MPELELLEKACPEARRFREEKHGPHRLVVQGGGLNQVPLVQTSWVQIPQLSLLHKQSNQQSNPRAMYLTMRQATKLWA